MKYSNTKALLLANRSFERAEIIAKAILANQPDHIRSRPVLVWMMQKELLLRLGSSQKGLFTPALSYLDIWNGEGGSSRAIFPGQGPLSRGVTLSETSKASTAGSESDSLFRIIEQAATQSGDYRLLAECLLGLVQRQGFPEAIKELEKVHDLQSKTMVDINGSLESLISKYYMIQGAVFTELPLLENALYNRFVDFHRSIHFLWDESDIDDTSDGTHFFDIPLTKWTAQRVVGFLSKALGRKEEAALEMAQAERVKEHLPHFSQVDVFEDIVEGRIRMPTRPRRRSLMEKFRGRHLDGRNKENEVYL